MDQHNQGLNSEEMFNADPALNEGQNPNPNQPRPQVYLPQASVTRIMRRILPPHAKISDEAKETMQVCVSKFISHVTAEANKNRSDDFRETIFSEDIIASMAELQFSEYVVPLSMMLNRLRSQERTRASPYTPVARTRVRNQVDPQVMARGTRAGLSVNPPQPVPIVDNGPPAQYDGLDGYADPVDYYQWFFGDGEVGSSSGNNL